MMTKMHFESAAMIVREMPEATRRDVARAFGALFKGDNPRFDVDRFRAACGLVAPAPELPLPGPRARRRVNHTDA